MSWFEKHLNWTYLLAYLVLSVVVAVAWEFRLIGVIMWVVAGWVVIQKKRSLWWVLLAPILSPLWLKNKSDEN